MKLYRKLKLQNKILITYMLFILIPLMCFFLLVNRIVTNHSQDKSMYSAEQSMGQTQLYANQKLYNATKLLNSVFLDSYIYKVISQDYSTKDTMSQYQTYSDLEIYITKQKENNEIAHMNVYMPESFSFVGGEEIKSFKDLKQEQWYKAMIANRNRTMYAREHEYGQDYITVGRLVSDVYDRSKYIGAIKIYINEEIYKQIVDNFVTTKGGVCYIVNAEGEIITASKDMNDKYLLTTDEMQNLISKNYWSKINFSGSYAFTQVHSLDYTDWGIVSIIPKDSIRRESRGLTIIMVLFMLLIFIITYILAYVISKTMVGRVVKLNDQMIASRSGTFHKVEVDVPPGTKDEIDMLSESYNELIYRIEQYANAQVEYSKAIKNAELKVLQEQINPHFLYNVLDLIGWMAFKKEYDKIIELVRALAEFYKIGIHRGKETLTVEKEMEHLRLYVTIQKIRYNNLLDPEFDIPDDVKQCIIQKSLFLPLVENAINHGLRHEECEGKISISAKSEGNDIIFCIRDNGRGISNETVAQLMAGTYDGNGRGGFGIKNLIERIKLYYGNEYGITFGDCNDGTVIYITVPKITDEKK